MLVSRGGHVFGTYLDRVLKPLDLMCREKLEILVIVKSGMSPHHSVDFRNEVRRL